MDLMHFKLPDLQKITVSVFGYVWNYFAMNALSIPVLVERGRGEREHVSRVLNECEYCPWRTCRLFVPVVTWMYFFCVCIGIILWYRRRRWF